MLHKKISNVGKTLHKFKDRKIMNQMLWNGNECVNFQKAGEIIQRLDLFAPFQVDLFSKHTIDCRNHASIYWNKMEAAFKYGN